MRCRFTFTGSLWTSTALSAAIFLGGFFLSGLSVQADIVNVTGNITTNTTWTADHTYFIKNSISVNSGVTLTVASGTVVKTNSTSSLTINGSLNAIGDPANLIYFTSKNDDVVGSSTASSTGNPAKGDWDCIGIASGASTTITNAVIRYGNLVASNGCSLGGALRPTEVASLGTSTFTNVIFASSSNSGLNVASGTASVTSSTFANDAYGLRESGKSSVTLASSTFVNNSSDAAYLDVTSGLTFTPSGNSLTSGHGGYEFGGTMGGNETLVQDLPYVIGGGTGILTIASGTTLTVNPGAIIKVSTGNPALTVNAHGTLDAEGTTGSPIYFTSINDDVGGDTNGDGASSTPAAGDWSCAGALAGASTTITNTIVRYAGKTNDCSLGGAFRTTDLAILGGTATLINVTLASSSNYGLNVAGGTVTITSSTFSNDTYGIFENGTSTVTLTSSTFSGNTSNAAEIDTTNSATFIPSGDTVTSGQGGFYLKPVTVGSNALGNETLYQDLAYVTDNLLTIPSGETLSLKPGAVVKFNTSGQIDLNASGTLDAEGGSSNPIYFTSLKDNAIDPGTNGTTTSNPAAGDWQCIGMSPGASTTITNAIVRYAASSTNSCGFTFVFHTAQVAVTGGTANFTGDTFDSGGKYGLYVSSGTVSVVSSTFSNNPYGLYISNSLAKVTVTSSSFKNNTTYGLDNASNVTSSANAVGNYWNAVSGPYNAHSNPLGTGDHVSDYVTYTPWLTSDPRNPEASIYFNGSSDLIYPASSVDFTATQPFTIEFWYRTPQPTSTTPTFIDSRNGIANEGFLINRYVDQGISFTLNCDSGTLAFNAAPGSQSTNGANDNGTTYDINGIWHQVAITKDGGTTTSSLNVYFDGVSQTASWVSSVPISGNCFNSTSTDSMFFGRSALSTSTSLYLSGNMDEIRISSTTESSAAIANDWNQEVTSTSGLLGLWQFNGTTTAMTGQSQSEKDGSPTIDSTDSPFGHFWYSNNGNPPGAFASVTSSPPQLLWRYDGSNYATSVASSAVVWNALGSVSISSTTATSSMTLNILDEDNTSSSAVWYGHPAIWVSKLYSSTSTPTSTVDHVYLNTAYLGGYTSAAQQNAIIHEFGHALGLDHSYWGNIMNYWYDPSNPTTTLGSQDKSDYYFIYGKY